MTMHGLFEDPVIIVARFSDSKKAEEARSAVQDIFDRAQEEVDSLYERQGGVADVFDIKAIYAKFGFANDIGWTLEQPVIADGNEIIWEAPAGMILDEAQLLLLALGAQDITIQPSEDEDLLMQSFHPLARLFWEDEPGAIDMESDILRPLLSEKKILH